MSEMEKKAMVKCAEDANALTSAADEGMVLALAASYLAGKKAGLREAQTFAEDRANMLEG